MKRHCHHCKRKTHHHYNGVAHVCAGCGGITHAPSLTRIKYSDHIKVKPF